jgi:lipopolysaccharide transport system ATP-binding protein
MHEKELPKKEWPPKEWQIGICGTFDVENFGDLLFPIIAETELSKRLGAVKLHRFSYHAKTPPQWPYTVTSLTDLPAIAANLDGMLIGGGFIIRFDKEVADGYYPPTTAIHHPTGYWLTPALIALQHGIPLIWNAPGMHCNAIPLWAEPLLQPVLEYSRHVRVRDTPTQMTLARFVEKNHIAVLPDTAFGLSQVIDDERPSADFTQLRERSGLSGRYIVIQAIRGLDIFLRCIKNYSALLSDYHFLILPIGPVLGDHESIVGNDLPRAVQLPFWPQPTLLAELIGHADAVIGHSYHLAITALAFGVPIFSSADLAAGKYTALGDFETLFPMPRESEIDPQWFIARLGKKYPCAAAIAAREQLDVHWNQVAAIISEGAVTTQPVLNCFCQALPGLLETEYERAEKLKPTVNRPHSEESEVAMAALRLHIGTMETQLTENRHHIDALEIERNANQRQIETIAAEQAAQRQYIDEMKIDQFAKLNQIKEMEAERSANLQHIEELSMRLARANTHIVTLNNSYSIKITAPLRFIMRALRYLTGKPLQ